MTEFHFSDVKAFLKSVILKCFELCAGHSPVLRASPARGLNLYDSDITTEIQI